MEEPIKSYQDLRVWKLSMDLAVNVYKATSDCPTQEQYALQGQMRRAAVSVLSNIVEGFGRETKGLFVQFLRTAQGSLKELETRIPISGRVSLLTELQCRELIVQCADVGKMLGGLIRSVKAKTNDE